MKIKNLKINNDFKKFATSCIITAGISATAFKLVGPGLPFYLDDIKLPKGNLNLITQDKQIITIDTYGEHDNLIYHYDKWYFIGDNTYKRKIAIYKINNYAKNLTKKTVNEILETNELKDYLGTPYVYEETKKNISEEEKNNKGYIQILYYDKNKGEYAIQKESISHNVIATLSYIITNFTFDIFSYENYKKKKKDLINN